MSNYVNLDMTFTNLCSAILQEYKEPIAGSNAVPLDYVKDIINVVYMDIFNSPELRGYTKINDYSFTTKANQKLEDNLAVGAASAVLDDTSDWPASGRFVIDGQDYVDFTANDLATTLTTTALTVQQAHLSGDDCELAYSLPSTIDNQKMIDLLVGGVPYSFVRPGIYFNKMSPTFHTFTIFESYLYVKSDSSQKCLMTFEEKLTLLSTDGSKPSFIPGNWRFDLLVSGSIERIGVRDDMRTGWDWHAGNYKTKRRLFIAEMNNPVKSEGPSRRPSVYDY